MVFEQGYSENSKIDIDRVVVDLTDWDKSYPTGAIAYDGADAVCSEYCSDESDFIQFFEDTSRYFGTNPIMEVRTDAIDWTRDDRVLTNFVRKLKSSFDDIVEAQKEGVVDYYPITPEEEDLFMKAQENFEELAKERGLISEEADVDNDLEF